MSDISKCNGNGCPLKKKCYRYTAPEGYWQAWGDFTYDNGCDHFWEVKKSHVSAGKNVTKKVK